MTSGKLPLNLSGFNRAHLFFVWVTIKRSVEQMRKRVSLALSSLLLSGAWAGVASAAAVIPISVSGYNQDVVVEAGAPATAAGVTTATMDGGVTAPTGGTWYEQGFNTNALTTGLPAKGTIIVSAVAADHTYQFPKTYGPGNGAAGTTNDAFAVGQGSGSPTIALTTPLAYSVLSLIGSAGHGPNTVNYTITHADTTTETGSLSVGDWFNGTAAYNTNGRLTVNTGAFDNVNAGNPRLYAFDITLTNTTSPVISVGLTSSSTTSTAAFFALSGSPVPEPATLGIVGIGLAGLLVRRHRA